MRRAVLSLAVAAVLCMAPPMGAPDVGAAGYGSATVQMQADPVADPIPQRLAPSKNRRILTDNPEHVGAVLELGRVYEGLSQFERAVDLYEAALTTLPDNTVLHLRVAAVYRWLENYPAARTHYDAVLALQPDNNEALLGRAYINVAPDGAEVADSSPSISPPAAVRHQVASGETLGTIAADYLGSAARWQEVWRANTELADPDHIIVGQVLQVPVAPRQEATAFTVTPPVSAPESRDGAKTLRYVVRDGDTLGAIAARHLGDAALWQAVWAVNDGIENPDVIHAGQVLALPVASDAPAIFVRHTVKDGDTLGGLAATYLGRADRWEVLWKANHHLANPHRIVPGDELMVPVTQMTQVQGPAAPASFAPSAAAGPVRHVVSAGDTLRGIALQYLGDAARWSAVWKANPGITNPLDLPAGRVIVVPVQRQRPAAATGKEAKSTAIRHTVQPGDTLHTIAADYLGDSARWKTVWTSNPGLTNPLELEPGQVLEVPTTGPYGLPLPTVPLAEKPAPLPRQVALMRHTVRPDETLGTIAGQHLGDPGLWAEIWRANSTLSSPHMIVPGQVLKVPAPAATLRRIQGHPL